jgi:hypothetical protein
MERREFMKMGSAAAVGPALWPAEGFCIDACDSSPCVSVGYLPPETAAASDADGESVPSAPGPILRADNMWRGDGGLVDRGCRVTVHGLFPSPAAAEQNALLTLSLEVSYEPFQPVSYRAWSYENIFAPNVSHQTSFHVPVTQEHGLNLSLFLRRAVSGTLAESEHAVRISPGAERGMPKLRAGTYFLGIHANAATREGQWGRYQLASHDGESSEEDRWTVVRRRFPGFEPRPVGFPYLVLSVGYGGEEVEEIA